MDGADPDPQSSTTSTGSHQIPNSSIASEERTAAGSKSSKSSDGSSMGSFRSPSLSPSQNHPMTSSLISNLDLGEGSRRAGISGMAPREEDFSSDAFNVNGRTGPLAPSHVLGQPTSLSRAPLSSAQEDLTSPGADDSALDALMEAHQKTESNFSPPPPDYSTSGGTPHTPPAKRDHSSTPHARDASFGLDPDADTTHSLEGTPFRIARTSSHHHHTSNHRSIYDAAEEISAPSHTTASSGAPETMKTNISHTQTVPTASATGMPRIFPRRTSRSPPSSAASSSYDDHSSQPHAPDEMMPQYAPSGSLTLAIFSKNISWQRRGYLLLASIAINLGLPFINGVMLGFGEIFARSIVAPYIGLAPAAININAPGPRAAAGTSGAGLRYAGIGESKGAGGKVSVESWEVEAGQRGRPTR